MKAKILTTLAAVLWGGFVTIQAQEEEFSVMTLNVDGLPAELVFSINPEGPGEKYTPEIGDYLLQSDIDIIGVQENFNFYDLLFQKLDDTYLHDLCYGKMTVEGFVFPYPYDGINLLWKKSITGERTDSAGWAAAYGVIDHANDELTRKGFRRYELTLPGGGQIVAYNGHWDASDDKDEVSGDDTPDRLVRMIQWRQIRDHILNHLDNRPVIVMGDANTYYCRDSVKQQFIDFIEETGRATVKDAWIEMEKSGEYPQLVTGPITHEEGASGWSLHGEMLDKILYISPTEGSQLTVLSYHVDSVSYMRNDAQTTPLGDHFPVTARFRLSPTNGSQGICTLPLASPSSDAYYDLNGRRLTVLPSRKGVYIYHGHKVVIR
jgi:endonuclease/exonuclease/phosphatase family metal-dependent hydrolase